MWINIRIKLHLGVLKGNHRNLLDCGFSFVTPFFYEWKVPLLFVRINLETLIRSNKDIVYTKDIRELYQCKNKSFCINVIYVI